jgi:putative ABC transport system permease protein
MKTLRAALLRLAGGLGLARRRDSEITEELRSHRELLVEEYRRRGLSDAEAHRAAAAKFGSLASAAEAYRDRRGLPVLEHVARDCRYAARSLSHTRVLSVSMILVLAFGIGLTTTMATLFHAVVFRRLSLPEPDRVVKLSLGLAGEVDRRVNGHTSQFSYPELALYQSATRALLGVAGARRERAAWFRGGERRPIGVALVTPNYFTVLQVRPAFGRLLTDSDRRQPAAVISHRLWKDAFGQDPAVVGASMLIDRMAYTVIGVAERSFGGTEVDVVDAWLPLDMAATARGDAGRLTDMSLSWLQVIGRLAPGASLTSAAAEARVIATRYDAMHPGQRTTVFVTEAAALDSGLQQSDERSKVIAVGVAVGLLGMMLLLICTSNAASLLLARGVARQKEIAIRIALGAGRWRIVQQLVTESVLLALAAAALGVALCTAVLRAAAHALPMSEYFDSFAPDVAVLTFAILAALSAALLFGVGPALYSTRIEPLAVLKQDTMSLGERMPASRLRHWLVAGQVAVSLVLLVVSALLARGVEHALRIDSGFPLTNLYAIAVDVPSGTSRATDRATLIRRLALALKTAPGVDVGLATIGPFVGAGYSSARASHMAAPIPVLFNRIDSGYFRTLGVATVAGRAFEAREDRTSVIVNARLARAFWGNDQAAIGQTLVFPDERPPSSGPVAPVEQDARVDFRTGTVVGVVPTLQTINAGVPDGPGFYVPLVEDDLADASFLVRAPARSPLQRLLDDMTRGSDAAAGAVSIEESLRSQTSPARLASAIIVLVGVLTLLIAGAGIYGIVAHSVVSRTHEIGVHVALGAPRARILRLVVGSALRAIASGTTLGTLAILVGATVASEALQPILFGVRALDPLALAAAAFLLIAITGAAAYLPARRALGVRPIDALRQI